MQDGRLGAPTSGHDSARRAAFETCVIAALIICALYIGRTVLVPLSLAIFLTFLLSPTIARLRRFGVPRGAAVASVTLAAFLLLVTLSAVVTRQVSLLALDLPKYQFSLQEKIRGLRSMADGSSSSFGRAFETLKSLRGEIEHPAGSESAGATKNLPAPREQTPREAAPQSSMTLQSAIHGLGLVLEPLATIGIVLVFVMIMLYSREDMRDRAIRLLGVNDLERTTRAMDDAGERLNRFFFATTLINTTFGIAICAGLWVIGVPNPVLWGVVAALARFIPFIGVPIAAIVPVVLAFIIDPGWTMLAATLALFIVVEVIVSQVVETLVQGEATGLSALAILVSTAFWTLLWGPIGLLLAVPLTVVLIVLGRHIEPLGFLDVLLGSEPALTPVDKFYQRILSDDPEEAAELAETLRANMTPSAFYDTIVMGMLHKGALDARNGRLDQDRQSDLFTSLDAFLRLTEAETENPPVDRDDEPDTTRPPVLIVAARSEIDFAAAQLAKHLLSVRAIPARAERSADLKATRLGDVELATCTTVCISTFDSDLKPAHLKFLVRRIRRLAPQAEIIGCFWGVSPSSEIAPFGVDEVARTVSTLVDLCVLRSHSASLKPVGVSSDSHPSTLAT